LKRLRKLAALALPFVLFACAREKAPPAPASVSVSPPHGPPISDAAFVATNGSIDLFAIRSSELALQRSSSARVREFAETMIRDHRGTSGQLSLEGRRLNLLPSATLRAPEQAMLDALQSSGRFDEDYVRDQRTIHSQAVAIDAAYLASGRSPTLRPVAASALPIEQRHQRLLAYL
jgi:putative membrane protein